MRVGVTDRKWIFFGERMTGEGPRHALFAGPLKRASAIAAIGSWAMEDYKRRYPSVPVFNIPYHCELAPFMELGRSPRGSDAPVTFLFCGQMIARKGLDHLLAAFALLPPAARLLLVGREAELPALLEPLPATVRERIEYAGFQAPEALAGFFAKADVFVLPSRHDGWGVVVNQAIAAGLPVIVSDHVGAGFDCVRSGENGFVFPMGDVPALATALRHFIDAPEDIARFGARSREIAVDFTPSIGAEKWVRALAAVSGRDEFGTVLKPEPMNRVVV
jgi:glycosyltransferase involved in cell wall biosynthesis